MYDPWFARNLVSVFHIIVSSATGEKRKTVEQRLTSYCREKGMGEISSLELFHPFLYLNSDYLFNLLDHNIIVIMDHHILVMIRNC